MGIGVEVVCWGMEWYLTRLYLTFHYLWEKGRPIDNRLKSLRRGKIRSTWLKKVEASDEDQICGKG